MNETEIKNWRIIDIINWGTQYFKLKGIDEARLTIELMLCHILKCKRVDLYVNFEKPLTKSELENLKELIKRRLRREPLQYIIGKTEFMGLEFKLTPAVLIPRPETEILVERALETLKKEFADRKTPKVLDIGTGSGNIAISLAKFLGDKITVIGIDISKEAIELAKENAQLNGVKNVEFIQLDLFDQKLINEFKKQFDLIVSNPPYIAVDEIENLQDEIKKFEPRHAITDGANGLSFYKKIAKIGKELINETGFILVEIAYGQAENVKKIFTDADYGQIEIFKDYLGIERVVKIKVG
ncbi:peptide chain release factor N(5)-glutamine methyltransferase [Candidatus Kryptobacter tengchongensis]|uniref:Release factor glutamine methyltransferase n=1 Tax=Kryptobacter tengchongensis TaxID=1643429 RepID=A0A916LHZ7_KRYT1|nr:peptide chain release factor N(5)-glutamine methyltransferase [Candidatus Kryptobacter tengchongensis]CUS96379.1 release factor glutamine methyltransferase [Candidatus Kryptobacter tengchongensis]